MMSKQNKCKTAVLNVLLIFVSFKFRNSFMKTLILVRHAKSSWKYDVEDIDRPLNKRGKQDAKLIAKHTKQFNYQPNLVWCSPAQRTLETAKYFLKHWKIPAKIFKQKEQLYDFSGSKLIDSIKNCDNAINTLMIFTHNYAITYFANAYSSHFFDNIPTCGFVVIHFDMDNWEDLQKGNLGYHLFPKGLKNK